MRRLLIRPGAVGDFVVSLPALESLRADYTEVWCAAQNVPLARFAQSAQSIVSAGLDRVGLLNADDVMERLCAFDSIISWYGTNRPDFRDAVRALPFVFLPALPHSDCHAVDFYRRQAAALSAGVIPRFPKIDCPGLPRSFAVVHPFASSKARRAPIAVFESAAEKLARSMPVHWLCGPEETLPGATRIDDLYQLGCWLRGARIFIGNDSGISHVAAAVGTPVMALFMNGQPRVWAPRGFCATFTRLKALDK